MRVSNALDERVDYTLDAMGGRTLEQIHGPGGAALAKTQSRAFDALGRLLQSIGAANQTTSYAYDNVDNLGSVTDPLSNLTGQSFDALNRLIQVAAPLSSTTGYGYDAHDNQTSVTDPRGLVTAYVYDGLDNLIEVSSPDTGDAGQRVGGAGAGGVGRKKCSPPQGALTDGGGRWRCRHSRLRGRGTSTGASSCPALGIARHR